MSSLLVRRSKSIFSLLLVFCMVFSFGGAASAQEGRGQFSYTSTYEIPLAYSNKTPSINVTTSPDFHFSENISVILEKKINGEWKEKARSQNSAYGKDTCALNPKDTGEGWYRIVLVASSHKDERKTGSYEYIDWNN
ncbi:MULTISPECIES: hypothetical protein [unclassified Brevibacillus]|uniref:hypothetical protein n=1 Tax=unclassified Brevibacillus TaxID=2684853 RepID=UPI00356360CB